MIDASRVLTHHRLDLVLREAALAKVAAQPLEHEAMQVHRDAIVEDTRREAELGEVQQLDQIQGQGFLGKYAQHAQGLPAKAIGVLVPGGREADAVDADQRIEPVGQRDRAADVVRRQLVACDAGEVVLLDRARHQFVLFVV